MLRHGYELIAPFIKLIGLFKIRLRLDSIGPEHFAEGGITLIMHIYSREIFFRPHIHCKRAVFFVNLVIPALAERHDTVLERTDIEGDGIVGIRQSIRHNMRIYAIVPCLKNHFAFCTIILGNFLIYKFKFNRIDFIPRIRLNRNIHSNFLMVICPRQSDGRIGSMRQSNLFTRHTESLRETYCHRMVVCTTSIYSFIFRTADCNPLGSRHSA